MNRTELEKQIRQALATGGKLPPGVVVTHGDQPAPEGATPLNPQPHLPPKSQNNPLPEGDEGLKILRLYSGCPIPDEATKLNRIMQAMLHSSGSEEESFLEEPLAKGLLASIRASKYCGKSKKIRTACTFDGDPQLLELHNAVKKELALAESLDKQLAECIDRAKSLHAERWEKAVKAFGLNPDKYLYQIDEDTGKIEQVDLDCTSCKGAVTIRKTRQELAEALLKLEQPKKEDQPTVADPLPPTP